MAKKYAKPNSREYIYYLLRKRRKDRKKEAEE